MTRKRPRVLLLVDWVPQGDSLLLESFRSTDLDCDILGFNFHQSRWNQFNKVFSYWPRCLWLSIRAYRRRRDYDYMLAWSQLAGTLLGLIKFLTFSNHPKIFISEAVIVERENFIWEKIRTYFTSLAWRKVDHVGFMSEGYKKLMKDKFKLSAGQCVMLKSPLVAKVPLEPSGFRRGGHFLSVGRSRRDYGTLMRAAEKSPHHFVVLTSGEALAGFTIPDNVTVHRDVFGDEARRLLEDAAAVVIPLDRTNSPAGDLTLTEVMSHGKPVIVTETIVTKEYIVHGQNGLLVPFKDPEAIAAAVDFISSDPQRAEEMGKMARETVLKEHTMESFARQIAAVITNNLKSG